MTSVFAVDPGPKESAFVEWDGDRIIQHDKQPNECLLALRTRAQPVIEMIASLGMPVGAEVFDTCIWIGKFMQAWGSAELMFRREVKLHLCNDSRAKDGNIRQALIDRLGAPGTKANPGVTYGISGDEWQALALAVTWWDKHHPAA